MHQLLAESEGVEEDVGSAKDNETIDEDTSLLSLAPHTPDCLAVFLSRPECVLIEKGGQRMRITEGYKLTRKMTM